MTRRALERALRETAAARRGRGARAGAADRRSPRTPRPPPRRRPAPRGSCGSRRSRPPSRSASSQRDSGLARAFERLRARRRRRSRRRRRRRSTASSCPRPGGCSSARASGLWVVERSGKRKRLGAWRRRDVVAARPLRRRRERPHAGRGRPRRRAASAGGCAVPSASASRAGRRTALHVAYRSGRTLRIVYGNGEHDVQRGRPDGDRRARVAAERAAHARLGGDRRHRDRRGRAHRQGAAGRSAPRPVRDLAWSADGRRLLIAGRRTYTIHDLATGERDATRLPAGTALLAAAFAPTRRTGSRSPSTPASQTEVRVAGRDAS